ncbi:MAG: ATP-binding cassette subfamily F protein uup [Polyangiales bacterium]|jgi:ATP-binding cassette subfamily F protein uup
MTPIITAKGLAKSFGPTLILEGSDVSIGESERVGLVGDNGAGKSTLAKMLAGMIPADSGEIAVRRDARIAYLSQRPVLDAGLTAHDVVMGALSEWRSAKERHAASSDAMSQPDADFDSLLIAQESAAADVERLGGWDADREVQRTLDHLGILDPSALVETLSGGERRRVDLARLLVSAPDFAILDEPTNHLDVETIEWLERYLTTSFRGALLLVTHDRYVLENVALRTLELDHGRLFSYKGGWSAYLQAKDDRIALEARSEANRQNFLRTELEWLRRSPSARRTKSKSRAQRAEAAIANRPLAQSGAAKLSIETERLGNTVLEVLDVSVDIEGRRLVKDFELRLTQGERIGIIGRSGCGKTSLLRVMLGIDKPAEGEVNIGKNTNFAYFDQSRTGLDDNASIQENVAGKATRIDFRGTTIDIRSYMARFLFDGGELRQKVGSLSGGERARVALAKLLLKPANVLVFDEPTNDLDVATLGALEELLVEANATAIIVSHDRYFLDRVATSIVVFEGEGKVVRYVGDYETYTRLRAQQKKDAQQAKKEPGNAKAKAKAKKVAAKPKNALSGKEKRELAGMMEHIDVAEKKTAALSKKLADPSLYAGDGDVSALVAEHKASEDEVARLMARWEELDARGA